MYKVIGEGSYQGMLDPRIMTSKELKNLPYEKRITIGLEYMYE